MKKTISLILVLALWGSLAAFAWCKPAAEFSDSERRPLEQFPELGGEELVSGNCSRILPITLWISSPSGTASGG